MWPDRAKGPLLFKTWLTSDFDHCFLVLGYFLINSFSLNMYCLLLVLPHHFFMQTITSGYKKIFCFYSSIETRRKWFPLILGNTGKKKEIYPFIWIIQNQTLFARFIIMSTVWVVPCFFHCPCSYRVLSSLLLSTRLLLTWKALYSISPVLAIILLAVFTPLKIWLNTICR